MKTAFKQLQSDVRACTECAAEFTKTASAHNPRPVFWLSESARILIAGQAPGVRVHDSGRPFTDPSGDRLRDWMGVSEDQFYDRERVAILPMAFCFPGYDANGSDLPPPRRCAQLWRAQSMALMPSIELTLLVGGYAQKWHLPGAGSVTETVSNWREFAPGIFPLPHPSWRNTGWLKKHPWFETDLLPQLRARVSQVMNV